VYAVHTQAQAQPRIVPFDFGTLTIPDGVYSMDWYKKDLLSLQKIEYLGRFQEYEHYLLVTQRNVYQGLLDGQGNFTLIEATGITGPLEEITFAQCTEDASTVLIGGITQLNRAFLGQLYLLPGSEKKLPNFSGITYQYVQNLAEQYTRRPQKMVLWGEDIFLLTAQGEVELYEKQSGTFNFAGFLGLEETILDMELLGNVLCILTNTKAYSLDLRNRNVGVSLQTHFQHNKITADWAVAEKPLHLTKHGQLLMAHFPHSLLVWEIKEGKFANPKTLIAETASEPCNFQVVAVGEALYIANQQKIYLWSRRNLESQESLSPWLTISANIGQLFLSLDSKHLIYLSQDGEVGAIAIQP